MVAGGGRRGGRPSEPRARAWLGRWRAGDHELADRRSGPAGRHPRRTDPEREAVIAELRGQVRMSAVAIAEALGMPERTVRGVIARLGLRRPAAVQEPEPANRYERPMPGELIHIDVKKLGRIGQQGHRIHGDRRRRSRGIGWEFVHVCIDDCTRLAHVEVLADERKETVTAFLQRAVGWFAAHGVIIERLMTDTARATAASFTARPVRRWASATSSPAPTGPAPTARPNASSAPCSPAGPTSAPTPPAPSGATRSTAF